ncbi:MAG: hypothetical protein KBT00_04565 [Bacteroidales bacterium]|nr:hypothetical protein [Candidatus Cacconaster merdequi]
MLYKYNPKDAQKMTITLTDGRSITGEFFDGMRINLNSIPKGKIWYQTRHNDDLDMSTPVTIAERQGIAVNFCGTLISDTDLKLEQETDIEDVDYE